MVAEALSILDLPPLRGNPFDHRPIEPSTAQDLVGRDSLMIRLREHIISESPRNILLVGDSGSGRTSMVNALSSQVRNKIVSQFWPETDPVNSIINEISVHFIGYDVPRTTSRMCETLVEFLDKETGPLPMIALDYPSSTPLNDLLTRITPLLQRLRAIVIVTATPSQLKSLDDEVVEAYDTEHLDDFSKSEIQKLADNLIRRKARERWVINPRLMDAIMESTGGHPRDVVKLCRDLLDERRGNGSEGTLERLMSWSGRIDDVPEAPFDAEVESDNPVFEPTTSEPAQELEDDIVIPYSQDKTESLIKNDSIIINTTPLGMQTNQAPFDLGLLHQNQILIDVIYTPLETSFLKLGSKIGAKTLNGLDMFIHQGLASLDLWFGESLSKQVNFTQLKTYLESKLC